MQRVRVGIIGTGASVEWAILPALCGADAMAPPDSGAWWSRRPAPSGDIRYQASANPEIVALCDIVESEKPNSEKSTVKSFGKTSPRLELLARAARGVALYDTPRAMLREMPLDALLLATSEEDGIEPLQIVQLVAQAPGLSAGVAPPRWVWIDGPPARSLAELGAFARAAAAPGLMLWIAAPLKRSAAHRAARRLIERDGIGQVTALQARFPFSLDAARFGAAYAAFDLLLSFVPGGAGRPHQVSASRHSDGAASVLLQLEGGVAITALFNAADTWNSPLPRLEICGTQGRYLICEAGRRLWHHVPREGARLWEPPGLATHVSAPNLAGYAEDLKAFLSVCAHHPAPFNAERALDDAARALGALEATLLSLETGQTHLVEARGPRQEHGGNRDSQTQAASPQSAPLFDPPRNLTLDLS